MPIRDTFFGDDYRVGFGEIKADEHHIFEPDQKSNNSETPPPYSLFKQIKPSVALQQHLDESRVQSKLKEKSALRFSEKEKQTTNPQFPLEEGRVIKNANPVRFDARRGFDIETAPEVNDRHERKKAILEDKPARFKIERNPKATEKRAFLSRVTKPEIATKMVNNHSQIVEKISKKHGMDPDFVKAVMWTETYRGDHWSLNRKLDKTDFSNSKLPMNINGDMWSKIINKRPDDLFGKENNIEAGVILLKKIQDRLDDPSPDKVGSLWNSLAAEHTNNVGVAIQQAYKEKPWLKKK